MNLDSPEGQDRTGHIIQGGSREKSSGTFEWKELPRGSTVVSRRKEGIQTARLSASDRSGSRFGQEIGEKQDFNVRELPFKSNGISSTYQETILEGNNSEEGQQGRRRSRDS